MTLKTLEYIHGLLVENERVTRRAKDAADKALSAARNEGEGKYNSLLDAYDKAVLVHKEARCALTAFEEKKW